MMGPYMEAQKSKTGLRKEALSCVYEIWEVSYVSAWSGEVEGRSQERMWVAAHSA